MQLIKFSSINKYLLEGLINQTLFFNNVYNFNDPYECLFRYKVSYDFEKFTKFYLHHYKGLSNKLDYYFNNKNELEKLINKTFEWRQKNNAVCCFSEISKKTDILMWANYADKHKGICFVFDSNILKFGNKVTINGTGISKPTGPHKITYSDKYLDLDPLNNKLDHNSFLTTKFNKWKNEKEYRYISPISGSYRYNTKSLVEVIFGLRTTIESIEAIKNVICQRNEKVLFKQIDLLNDKFKFKIKPL